MICLRFETPSGPASCCRATLDLKSGDLMHLSAKSKDKAERWVRLGLELTVIDPNTNRPIQQSNGQVEIAGRGTCRFIWNWSIRVASARLPWESLCSFQSSHDSPLGNHRLADRCVSGKHLPLLASRNCTRNADRSFPTSVVQLVLIWWAYWHTKRGGTNGRQSQETNGNH